jgi:hypothetical protein
MRSLFLIRSNIQMEQWKQIDFPSGDITVIQLSRNWGTALILNIYNDCKKNNTIHQLEACRKFKWSPKLGLHQLGQNRVWTWAQSVGSIGKAGVPIVSEKQGNNKGKISKEITRGEQDEQRDERDESTTRERRETTGWFIQEIQCKFLDMVATLLKIQRQSKNKHKHKRNS